MEAKFNILIIDDDFATGENTPRKYHYQSCFSDESFNLEYLTDYYYLKEFLTKNSIHAVILDVNLRGYIGTQKSEDVVKGFFLKAVDVIQSFKIPIILVSGHFNTLISWMNDIRSKSSILGYFTFEQIEQNNGKDNSIVLFVKTELYNFHVRHPENKGPNEPIKILLMSDFQFGDPYSTNDTKNNLDIKIKKALESKGLKDIDLIAVLGDISYSGLPSEFDKAQKWFVKFFEEIKFDKKIDYKKRILLIPGNHDISIALTALDAYKFSFKSVTSKENFVELRQNELQSEHLKYGLYPFREFALNLTNDKVWLTNNDLYFVNHKFSFWGIKIVHLNTVSLLNYKNPSSISFNNILIQKLLSEIESSDDVNFFTIFLSHNDDLLPLNWTAIK